MALASVDAGKPEWKKYGNKKYSRHNFHIDIAVDLINYAIEKESGRRKNRKVNSLDESKIVYPLANCEECYFLPLNMLTNGYIFLINGRRGNLVLNCKSGPDYTDRTSALKLGLISRSNMQTTARCVT